MPGTKTLRIRNCIHTTIILHFHLELMSKSVSPKTLGLELIKLDCIIIKFDLVTIKKARNELDESCGLYHIFPCVLLSYLSMLRFISFLIQGFYESSSSSFH